MTDDLHHQICRLEEENKNLRDQLVSSAKRANSTITDKEAERILLPGGYWIDGRCIFQEDDGVIPIGRFSTFLNRSENQRVVNDFASAMNAQTKEVERLREALKQIAGEYNSAENSEQDFALKFDICVDTARAALNNERKGSE